MIKPSTAETWDASWRFTAGEVNLVLNPNLQVEEYPLKRYYREVLPGASRIQFAFPSRCRGCRIECSTASTSMMFPKCQREKAGDPKYVYIYIYVYIMCVYHIIYQSIYVHVFKVCVYTYYQRKLGSNLPSYGWLLLNEGRCVTLHHITIRSVRLWDYTQWKVVCEFTSHDHEKCEIILNERWCASLHHMTMRSVRLYSMKGGVRGDIAWPWEVWDYTQWTVVCEVTITQPWEVWD